MKQTFLVLAFASLAIILFDVAQFYFRVRVGKKLAASAIPYERILPGATFRLLIIGDSTVYGTGLKDNTKTVAGLYGVNYPNISITNRGENGRLTGSVASALSEFPDDSFDLIVIHSGGNDIIRRTPFDKLEINLDKALKIAKKKGAHVAILHCGNMGTAPLFPFPVNFIMEARTRQVREMYLRKTKELGVTYVDLFPQTGADPFQTDPANYYAADGLHLGIKGNEYWFEHTIAALERDEVDIPKN